MVGFLHLVAKQPGLLSASAHTVASQKTQHASWNNNNNKKNVGGCGVVLGVVAVVVFELRVKSVQVLFLYIPTVSTDFSPLPFSLINVSANGLASQSEIKK